MWSYSTTSLTSNASSSTTFPIPLFTFSKQHFFPYAYNLIVPPQPHLSRIRYLDADSLSFTAVESNADFTLLTSDSPQDAQNCHPFVPTLPSPRVEQDGTHVFPLIPIQVTVLPNSGFTICLAFHHIATDVKSIHQVLGLSLQSERDIVKDPKGLKLIYFQELEHHESRSVEFAGLVGDVFTAVLSREQVEKLKKWVSIKCASYSTDDGTVQISTYMVLRSLFWVCMVRSEESKGNCVAQNSDELRYLLIPADCRDRLEFSLPSTYLGNCISPCMVAMKRSEIVGENGIVGVANVVEREIKDLKNDALRKAEMAMSDYKKFGKSTLIVAGSPKFAVYQTDFLWDKTKKSFAAYIESSGWICVSDGRDEKGGIEVALTPEKIRMNKFITILEEQLNNIN